MKPLCLIFVQKDKNSFGLGVLFQQHEKLSAPKAVS